MTIEWRPNTDFNIVDFRNDNDFQQSFIAPYIIEFQFSEPIVFESLHPVFSGWNVYGCGTQKLFARIQVAKNTFQDIYYDTEGTDDNQATLPLIRYLYLKPQDKLLLMLFPRCPAHMITINQIKFISPPPPPPPPPSSSRSISHLNKYYNLYITAIVTLVIIIIGILLFSLRHHIIITTK